MQRVGLTVIVAAALLAIHIVAPHIIPLHAIATDAIAADRIRLAVQRTGTLAWELDIIKAHGLDRKFDLAIERLELASTEAGKIALKAGSVDLMLSDWLWVARERSLGDKLVFYPSSSTLGAVMVPAQSPIKTITELRQEARRRRRPARQELAPVAGAAHCAPVSICGGRQASSTARRRCCRRRRCRASTTRR